MRDFSKYLCAVKSVKSKTFQVNLASATPAAPQIRRSIPFVTDESRHSIYLAKVKKKLSAILQCNPNNLLITMGASSAFLHSVAAITRPGDSIVIETPTYEPLESASKFLALKTLRFKRSGDFAKDVAQLKKLRTKAKVLVISNPNNPTGLLYSKTELRKLASLFDNIIIDEIFLPIFTGESTRAGKVTNIISIGGLSKTLGLSSLRIGWIKAAPEVLKRADQAGLNTYVDLPTLPLVGADAVLPNWKKIISRHRKLAELNRKVLWKFDLDFPGVLSHDFSEGHFGTLQIPQRFRSAKAFATALEKHSLKVCPCEDLGLGRSIRISTFTKSSQFSKAMKTISKFYE